MDNLKTIRWDSIFILHELQQFLDKSGLAEISLLNRLLRDKLKYKVMSSMFLGNTFLSEIVGYFNQPELISRDIKSSSSTISNFKCLIIDPIVEKLIRELCSYSSYLKCLKFSNLRELGYFIIPQISILNQLASLTLSDCHLSIRDFFSLLYKLEKLECLKLCEVVLILSQEETITEYDKPPPSTLKELTLYTTYFTATDSTNNPRDFIFNYNSGLDVLIYYFQLQHLPKLIKFNLHSVDYGVAYIANFLSLNPQLTHVKLPFEYFGLDYIQILSDHDNINSIEIDTSDTSPHYPSDVTLPYLHSINSLTINLYRDIEHSEIYDIIGACPNLTKLNISFYTYNSEFMTNVLKGLNLIYLKLKIEIMPSNNLDMSIFSDIKIINIEHNNIYSINYDLPTPPMKTKSIKISENYKHSIIYNSKKESYERHANWKTILSNYNIKLLYNDI
ncbi:hypothetical protein CONCODRAFT_10489 [Conidiobolus coronatus NRRL 28638]|uniref:RNI-like protein n=1 Tax=Conidiobolus coronatus (strain ATCC 28846 / CBS 209.66 / NRRL 28638) TaxID=796925 RepID=A0A137NXP7_CONC2|nr:hypothetical protein CONCODRAFT_10489 [Conidiobolus coronatus NRRL 28638]|eukprot:KXN67441.1 hypothetical protein CONCODRAFT_10489 [Conidiobolus coronatus NRRL 28638]